MCQIKKKKDLTLSNQQEVGCLIFERKFSIERQRNDKVTMANPRSSKLAKLFEGIPPPLLAPLACFIINTETSAIRLNLIQSVGL